MHRAAAALPSGRALPRIPRAGVWAVVAILVVVGAALLWVRDSSLVAVEHVTVTGMSGPETAKVTALLEDAAHDMTTLHVRADQLRSVMQPYPVVRDLKVSRDFPHGLHITVVENTPVAAVVADGTRTAVSGSGQLLRGAAQRNLPAVPLEAAPGGEKVVDRDALAAITALAAAPAELRTRVLRAGTTRQGGLVLMLRNGPALRFGGADRLAAKWAAAAAILADRSSAGATYLDLRYPERSAAGGLEDPATQGTPDAVNAVAAPPGSSTATPAATGAPTATP